MRHNVINYIVSGNTLFWCADESVVFFRKVQLLQVCILVLLQAKVVLQNVVFNVQGYHLLAVLASLIARVFLMCLQFAKITVGL